MLADPITLNTKNYVLVSLVDDESIRAVSGLALDQGDNLKIAHQETSKSGVVSNRRLVRFARSKANAAGVTEELVAAMTLQVPRSATFSSAEVTAIVDDLCDFFIEATNGPARLAKILNGEP